MMSDVRLRIIGECVIEVGKRRLEPEAPYRFALMLVLGCEQGRSLSRTELCELLFPALTPPRASHNLRQLLYRLRAMGAPIVSRGLGVELRGAVTESDYSSVLAGTWTGRQGRHPRELDVLPGYEPAISNQFADWIESLRSTTHALIRNTLSSDLRQYCSECAWDSAIATGRVLRQLDPASSATVSALAQALLFAGHKADALIELDSFIADAVEGTVDLGSLRRLQAKIAKSPPSVVPISGTLQGRQAAWETLSQLWSRTTQGEAQLCLVVGPPGIGKTRLSTDFRNYAIMNGGRTLVYECDKCDQERPHSLFAQLLPHLWAMKGSIGASPDLREHLDLLLSEDASVTPLEPASAEAIRRNIQLALSDLIEAVTSERPLYLLIDDAQFLDSASCAALRDLVGGQAKASLLVVCNHRSVNGARLLQTLSKTSTIIWLTPLSVPDSIALLTELLPHSRDGDFTQWCIGEAAGNPYYLTVLARSANKKGIQHAVPFDIGNLASSSYLSLDSDSRTVLESCLFLGRFASLPRVQAITCLTGQALLVSLRQLEDEGLLLFANGELRLVHSLLEGALRPLVPSCIAAALHHRIGECLESECVEEGYPAPKVWAAAESWIAVGEFSSATRMLRRCAIRAASMGEHRLAAQALLHIPQPGATTAAFANILRDAVTYAETAGDLELVHSTLIQLLRLQEGLRSEKGEIAELELRIMEADLQHGISPDAYVAQLNTLLRNPAAPLTLRVRAGIRLLIAADLLLDASLANATNSALQFVFKKMPRDSSLRRRAQLIFATVFGDSDQALVQVSALLKEHPRPKLSQTTVFARRSAAFALSRMGRGDLAAPILLEDYQFMAAHHVTSEALYCSSILAENCLARGDLDGAGTWLKEAATAMQSEEPRTRYSAMGYFSNAANLALMEGRLDSADSFLESAREHCTEANSPRLLAVHTALRMLISFARGTTSVIAQSGEILRKLYERGGNLGGQDCVVAALWRYEHEIGSPAVANTLLDDYLRCRRREETKPEWLLRTYTATDPVWH